MRPQVTGYLHFYIQRNRSLQTPASGASTPGDDGKPIEFGGFNISPADKVKQHQKGMVAAGAIYPKGSTWTVDAGTHGAATVDPDGDSGTDNSFRDFTTVWQKNLNFYWAPVARTSTRPRR